MSLKNSISMPRKTKSLDNALNNGSPLDLSKTEIAPGRILVLCPHPDDFDVVGVTLQHFHAMGCPLFTAVAPTYSGILDSFYGQPTTNQIRIETREDEQKRSLAFFGLDASHITFYPHSMDLDANGEMCRSAKNLGLIESTILNIAPDTIVIPHPNDSNPAHSAMYLMVVDLIIKHCLDIDLLLQMDPKTQGITVNAYTPINAQQRLWKESLLGHHKTQDHRNLATRGISLAQRVIAKNGEAARTLDCDWAEAFEWVDSKKYLFPIEVVTNYTDEIHDAFVRLTPQLAQVAPPYSISPPAIDQFGVLHAFPDA